MKWLITGAKGQLGQMLSAQLERQGHDFIALSSKQLDITNASHVNEVISKIKPGIIVNTAAWTDVERAEISREAAFEINERGVENLVLAARKVNAAFLQISTDYVFSGQSSRPWPEDSPLNPLGVYGQSKAAGEKVVARVFPERSYVIRTAWLYSEYGDNFAKTMCKLASQSNTEVRVIMDQIGQPTNARDLASQIIVLVNSEAKHGIYHVTNSGQASWYEFAKEIFKLSGADLNRIVPISSDEYPTSTKRPLFSVLSHDALVGSGCNIMRDWRIALRESIPAVQASIGLCG